MASHGLAASSPPISESEHLRRGRRKGSYHLVASKNKLPTDPEDEEEDYLFQYLTGGQMRGRVKMDMSEAKKELLRELAASAGDTTTAGFQSALERLVSLYDPGSFDARRKPHKHHSGRTSGSPSRRRLMVEPPQLEGMWITLSKPQFTGCLGMNENRDYLYTLGRMSFDMFRPTKLVCSIQGTFNPVHVLRSRDIQAIERIPRSLQAELQEGTKSIVRTYDIVTAFSIEPRNAKFDANSPNQDVGRRIKGLLTTYGYVIPNPEKPNRLSVWFTDGAIEVTNDDESSEWFKVFSKLPKRELKERTRVFGAKVIMGASPSDTMEDDGKMAYTLNRPVGGHETAYVDVLFLDESVRIVRSSGGALYVFARVPYFPDE